jgi:phosphoglycolate phosphatase
LTAHAAGGGGLGAVVFDLDGTLVDTAPDLHAHLNELLAALGRGPVALASVRPMIGDGARAFIQRALTATGGPPNDVTLDELAARFIARYTEEPLRGGAVFPGAVETLEALAARGVGLGVCTNKPQRPTERLLELLGVARHFGAVIGGDALPVRKPDGGHLRAVLERLGVPEPWAAVMVGDSRNDVLTARALGVPSVVVTFGYTTVPARELGADLVIDRFDELLPALARLARRAA